LAVYSGTEGWVLPIRRSSIRILAVLVALICRGPLTRAADPSADAEDLLAQERMRAAVEALLEDYFRPAADGDERVDRAIRTAQGLAALGPDVVPYVVNELEQEIRGTYDLCCYTLGLMGTPAAKEALRAAAARAEESPGSRGESLKVWAAWGLGLAGDPDAIRLLVEGRHVVANHAVHGLTSVLESVAIQTSPASVPILLDLLDGHLGADARWQIRNEILHALRRVGDAAAAAKVAAVLAHPDPDARREAAYTLSTLDAPESIAALAAALSDEDFTVRRAAAKALESLAPPGLAARVVERFEVESDVVTRGALYRLLAETAGEGTLARLASRAPQEDNRGRRMLAEAVALVDDPGRVPFLTGLLQDEDAGVALQAVLSLGDLGGDEAIRALVTGVERARHIVASAASEQLNRLGSAAAGATQSARIVRELGSREPLDRNTEIALETLARGLVEIGHVAAAPELAAALQAREAPLDPGLRSALDGVIGQLELIATHGRKVERWIDLASSPEEGTRQVALGRLARIGSLEAVRDLEQRFDSADRADRLIILRGLAAAPTARGVGLLERVLLGEAFDHPHEAELRATAAWAARRLGGDAMWQLLARAARRREGRDPKVLVYAALLGGPERGVPLLAELRRPRMRYLGWPRGQEQERLDWLARRLAGGRSVRSTDVPPESLNLR
jgi:HEAT repeat protein